MDEGNNHEYIVKEANEDPYQTVIEKTNLTATFTPRDMVLEQSKLHKVIKEITAKAEIEAATMANIEHHHPFVKEFSMAQLFALHMYYESRALVESIPPKVAELSEQLGNSMKEQLIIAERLGLDILPKTAEEVVDAAVGKIVGPEVAPEAPVETPAVEEVVPAPEPENGTA